MARERRTGIDQRAVVPIADTTQRTAVVARPTSTFVQPRVSTSGQLVSALADFNPKIRDIVLQEQDVKNKADALSGQNARAELGDVEQKIALGQMRREQSPFFQKGYLEMHGKLQASRFRDDLVTAMGDPSQFNPDTDNFDDFANAKLSESVNGMDDPHFRESYLPGANDVIHKLRASYTAQKVSEVQTKVQDGIFELTQGAAFEFVKNNKSIDTKTRNALYAQGRTLGVTYGQMDEHMFMAAREAALSGSGHPEAMDIFDERSADGTQPGMSSTVKWADKIMEVRRQAQVMQKKVKDEKDALTRFNTWLSLDKEATDATAPPEAFRNKLRYHLKSGILEYGDVKALSTSYDTNLEENQKFHSLVGAIRAGDMAGFAQYNDKPARVDKAFDAYTQETIRAAGPQGQPQAIAQITRQGARVGAISKGLQYQLQNVTPVSNPEGFLAAATTWQYMSSVDPQYAEKHVDPKQSMVYKTYWDQRNLAGATDKQALASAALIMAPEAQKRLSEGVSGLDIQMLRDKAQSEMISGTFRFGFGREEAQNKTYVTDTFVRLSKEYIALTGGSVEGAAEWAAQRIKATHTLVNGNLIPHNGKPNDPVAHPKFSEAATWYSEGYAKRAGDPDVSVMLVPDATTRVDGSYGVYRSVSGFPEGVRVDHRGLLNSFLQKDAISPEVLQKEQAAQQILSEKRDIVKKIPAPIGPIGNSNLDNLLNFN